MSDVGLYSQVENWRLREGIFKMAKKRTAWWKSANNSQSFMAEKSCVGETSTCPCWTKEIRTVFLCVCLKCTMAATIYLSSEISTWKPEKHFCKKQERSKEARGTDLLKERERRMDIAWRHNFINKAASKACKRQCEVPRKQRQACIKT